MKLYYIVQVGKEVKKMKHYAVILDYATDFQQGKFSTMEKEEYFEILGKALAIIPKNVVIHRLTGDGPKSLLISPLWTGNKKDVMNSMTRYFQENGIFQGCGEI